MGAKQIIKLIFLILVVLLVSAIIVCGFMLGKAKNIDVNNRRTRILLRVRAGCFLAMLILLFLVVVIT